MKILFFGDITGKSGRGAVAALLPKLREAEKPDLVIANIENAAHGKGVTKKIFLSLLEVGIDFFTSGNHIYSKPEAAEVLKEYPDKIIRPANFADSLPGLGSARIEANGIPVLMLNLNGTVFMETQFDESPLSNPFLKLDEILENEGETAKIKILDFHAEATSEKRAMGFFCDGRISAVLGTHTHVQSNDAQILPKGTGYLTDLGMVGARDSVIGVKKESVLRRFEQGEGTEAQKKAVLEIDESEQYEAGYALIEIDEETGKCQNIFSKVEYN